MSLINRLERMGYSDLVDRYDIEDLIEAEPLNYEELFRLNKLPKIVTFDD